MRYLVLFALFQIGIHYSLHAQGRYGPALPDSSLVCVSSVKGYLYQGIDNYIRIDTVFFRFCDELILESTNGYAVRDSQYYFLVMPEKAGKLRISVLCIREGKRELLGYKYFHVRVLPEPTLTLNGEPISVSDTLSRQTLLSCDSLGVFYSDDLPGSSEWLLITEFLLGYNYGGFHVSHLNPSNHFTDETRDILARLGPDHEISIKPTVKSMGKIQKKLPIYRIRIY